MKTGIKIPVYMLAAMALCIALLTLSACIPREAIQNQSQSSAEYFADRAPFAILYQDYVNTIQDNYSDTVLCDIAYCIDPSHPFTSSIRAKYAQGEYEDAYEGYLAAVNGREDPNREYGRYWHGSLVLIRPLLAVMPIRTIRILCGVIIMILQGITVTILVRKKKTAFAVCWLLGLLLVHPWMLFTSLEYGTAFLAASAASLAILLKKDHSDAGIMPFFMVIGVITCFLDFLTTETLTFTLPMLLLLADRIVTGREAGRTAGTTGTAKAVCLSVLKNGLCWLGGYLAMFALKLGLLAVVAGMDVVQSSMSEGLLRLGGSVRTANFSIAPIAGFGTQISGAIWHNLACLYPTHAGTMQAAAAWIPTLAILAVGFAVVYLLHGKIDGELFLPMGMVALLPYLRFLVLSNHSYEHFFITYRAQMVPIVVFLFFVFENGIRQITKARKGAK